MASVDTTFLQFEQRAIEVAAADGSRTFKDVDFALLTPMGSNGPIEREMNAELLAQWHEQGYSNRVNHYEAWKKGQEAPMEGTPIKQWPAASAAEIKMCVENKILTVEQLAAASMDAVKRLGLSGVTLQNKAKNYLNDAPAKMVGQIAALELRVSALEEELKRVYDEADSLREQTGQQRVKARKRDAA